jgi:clan AA aspartic protease
MGLANAHITLSNPRYPELKPLEVDALVDSGANWTCIPDHVRVQLQLEEFQQREVTTAGGAKHTVPYVGQLMMRFENRLSLSGAMVLGNHVLLGAIAMEDMDVVILPKDRKLVVNPENPNFPAGLAGVRPANQ